MANTAYLVLKDGTLFKGKAIGKAGKVFGEVVFNTAMVGYQELLTDPANEGLLVAQTFPLIGNYGINNYGNESDRVYAKGYIVRELCDEPSSFRCEGTLGAFMEQQGVVGICDIDTRHLTKVIREKGVMPGVIITADEIDVDAVASELQRYTQEAVTKDTKTHEYKAENGNKRVAIINFGAKLSLIEALTSRGCDVTVIPSDTAEVSGFDGYILSDGAGNPTEHSTVAARAAMASGKPVLGIGMGHLVMAIAKGMAVEALHCGHRGANQPVVCAQNGRTYITAQNHGYVVISAATGDTTVSYRNANDKSIEGLCYGKGVWSIQFTPDSALTSVSTSFVYDDFVGSL